MGGLIVILVLFALAWLFFLMPARRRRAQHAAMQDTLELGDEVITAGGMHGVVRELGDSELRIEIAPSVVVTLDRRAVAAVARDVEVEVEPEPAADAESAPQDGTPAESG
jgi:preprotein translocase subunit YajC